ncbi:MAG: hypothetical protein OEX02_07190 [Cyclobacteriaceae bacterium]|nr:hypothetical protein [Cyclobacteriaceae bacterium]
MSKELTKKRNSIIFHFFQLIVVLSLIVFAVPSLEDVRGLYLALLPFLCVGVVSYIVLRFRKTPLLKMLVYIAFSLLIAIVGVAFLLFLAYETFE